MDYGYTFENFTITNENKCAYDMAVRFAESGRHNPLCIYGGPETGKTHLLHAVRERIETNDPSVKVVLIELDELIEIIETIEKADTTALYFSALEYYSSADVILIDDIADFETNNRARKALKDYLTALYLNGEDRHKKIMLTSSLTDLAELRARFSDLADLLFFGEYAVINTPYHEQKKHKAYCRFDDDSFKRLFSFINHQGSLMVLAAGGGNCTDQLALSLAQYVSKHNRKVLFYELWSEMRIRYDYCPERISINIVSPSHSINVSSIRYKIKKTGVPDLIVIKNLQMMVYDVHEDLKPLLYDTIIHELKDLANETGVTILLLSNIPWYLEARSDKRPRLPYLNSYGPLVQCSDVIMLLYDDYFYNHRYYDKISDVLEKSDPFIECIVAKNNYGDTDTINIKKIW